MVARKPISGQQPAIDDAQSQQSVPGLRHRDSWEDYSTDEEHGAANPKGNAKSTANPDPTAATSEFNNQSVPASLRVAGGIAHPTYDGHTHGAGATEQETKAGGFDQVPEALRPGGIRKETNPFLRKKIPHDPAVPPTDTLANLDLNDPDSNPWNPTPKKQATNSSSVYSQPIATVQDGNDPFSSNPARPPIPTILPVLDPSDSHQSSFLQSPIEIQENPWSTTTTQIPISSAQPAIPSPAGSNNPFHPSSQNSAQHSLQPSPSPMSKNDDPFAAAVSKTYQPPAGPPPIPSPALMSVPSDDDGDLLVGENDNRGKEATPAALPSNSLLLDDNNIWDDLGPVDKGKGKAPEPPVRDTAHVEDWNLIDIDPSSGSSGGPRQTTPQNAPSHEQPTLPPRKDAEPSGWVSPRPPVDSKAETYQVKKIRWHDVNATDNPRISPILVQTANGPCPLVALVNALSLTTPPGTDDASLVAVLRSREQISLNLLLDAVFEELMSPRRTDEDAPLPDISDLYAFLQSLHTGMNVNPRFVPTAAMREAFQHTSLTHLHPSERATFIPGTFENTHEMSLYATFKIPLIHGWLPPASDPVHEALDRQAASYEDAQNLLFREEELDMKLSSLDGLNHTEQQLYQDLVTIKHFLNESATQLTAWGIQVIAKAITPGGFAILFRNDHFSTLYCHPQTKQLVTLVTDYGYRSHEEVVWESLVDINGERTQYLSGDFRVVGTAGSSGSFGEYSNEQGGEWQTVDNRRGRNRQQEDTAEAPEEPVLSAAEQEDRDLALALQLQEEEDERHREEIARRRREQELSSRVIEQQGRQPHREMPTIRNVSQGAPTAPVTGVTTGVTTGITTGVTPGAQPRIIATLANPRRPSNTGTTPANRETPPRSPSQQVRPLVPPRRTMPPRPTVEVDAPPPYEQAAQDEPYVPPPGHPNHPSSSPAMSRQSTTASVQNIPPRQGQRPAGQSAALRPTIAGSSSARDRDCTVM